MGRLHRWLASRRGGEDGTGVVELVALAPVYFALISLGVYIGQMTVAQSLADAAARSAARTISLERAPGSGAAQAAARGVASDIVDEGTPFCTSMGFTGPELTHEGDVPVRVTVTVTCNVDLSRATGIGIPGSRTVEATATEVIDRYREQDS